MLTSKYFYATPFELQYYPAAESGEGDVWLKDGTVYLRLGFVQKFTDLDAYVYENPNRVRNPVQIYRSADNDS